MSCGQSYSSAIFGIGLLYEFKCNDNVCGPSPCINILILCFIAIDDERAAADDGTRSGEAP